MYQIRSKKARKRVFIPVSVAADEFVSARREEEEESKGKKKVDSASEIMQKHFVSHTHVASISSSISFPYVNCGSISQSFQRIRHRK